MKAVINAKLVFPEEIREGSLLLEGDRILAAGEPEIPAGAEIIDAGGLFVGPGLIDEHVHGYSRYGESYDIIGNVREVAEAHLKHGTTTLTPSPSYSLRLGAVLGIISQCLELIREGNSTVAGIHLEGPYVNPAMAAGRKYAWKYSDALFESLFQAAEGHVLHCTYAPEMPWASSVEKLLQKYKVVMDIGHTRAGPADLYRAVEAGASVATHLFDATGHYDAVHAFDLTGDPQDCTSAVLLSIPGIYYELICDSKHAHTTAVSQRLALRTAGEDHIILISDSTCYKKAETDPSVYPEEDLRSAPDLNINHEGRLFGSRLTVAECAANFRKTTGADLRVLFKCASSNAAKALRLYDTVGSIHPGKRADLVFTDENFRVQRVFFRGEEVPEVRR